MEQRFNKLKRGACRVNNEAKLTPEIRDVILDRNTVLIIGTRFATMACIVAQPGMRLT
jgi:hypothetical protein